MKAETTRFPLNVPSDLFPKLKEIAAREGRTMTGQINLVLRRFVEAESQK